MKGAQLNFAAIALFLLINLTSVRLYASQLHKDNDTVDTSTLVVAGTHWCYFAICSTVCALQCKCCICKPFMHYIVETDTTDVDIAAHIV